MSTLAAEIRRRKLFALARTLLLAGLIAIPFVAIGRSVFGTAGFVALGIGVWIVSMNAGRMSVATLLADAIPLRYYEAPQLHEIVGSLSTHAGLTSMPMLYLMRSRTPNAATIGRRDEPVIIVTEGLLDMLSVREITGVLAHEIAHIRNNDLQVFIFAEVMKQLTIALSRFVWFLLLVQLPFVLFTGLLFPARLLLWLAAAPLLVFVLQLALLRTREFAADLGAVELTGDPEGLASALYRVSNPVRSVFGILFPVPQQTEHSLFRTHPAVETRIHRLLDIASFDHPAG